MIVLCEKCGEPLDVEEGQIGRQLACVHCGARFLFKPPSARATRGETGDFGGIDEFTPIPLDPLKLPDSGPVRIAAPDLGRPTVSNIEPQALARTPVVVRAVTRSMPTMQPEEVVDLPGAVAPGGDELALKRPKGSSTDPGLGPPALTPPGLGAAGAPPSRPARAPLVTPPPSGGRPPPSRPASTVSSAGAPIITPPPFAIPELPEIDLPAPKAPAPTASATRPTKSGTPRTEELIDLPAPKGASQGHRPPTPSGLPLSPRSVAPPPEVIDLPAPRAAIDLLAPKATPSVGPPPQRGAPSSLPAPRRSSAQPADLLQPKREDVITPPRGVPAATAPPSLPPLPDGGTDLVRPRDRRPPSALASIPPRPEEAELVRPKRDQSPAETEHLKPPAEQAGPPSIDLSLGEETPLPPNAPLSPDAPIQIAAPDRVRRPSSPDLDRFTPVGVERTTPEAAVPLDPPPGAGEPFEPAAPAITPPGSRTPSQRGNRPVAAAPGARTVKVGRVAVMAIGLIVAVGGIAAWQTGLLDLSSIGSAGREKAAIEAAQRLFGDDTVASYRKASIRLHEVLEEGKPAGRASALEAQARYAEVLRGVSSEAKQADQRVADLDLSRDESDDAQKARALKLLVAGKLADAERRIAAVVAHAPSDAQALIELGWIHAAAGDDDKALADYRRALTADANRAAAHFGLAEILERRGERDRARSEYQAVLRISPQHVGAAVALERFALDGPASEKRVVDLLSRQGQLAGPRELSDGWSLLGARAYSGGRRPEAQERWKRAIALDQSAVAPRVALARLLCESGQPQAAVPYLEEAQKRQPKSPEVLFALVQALLADRREERATATIAQARAVAPKDPRLFYWQGRALEAGHASEDEIADHYRAAIAADPSLLDAYVMLARLYQRSRPAESTAVMAKAEAQIQGDPTQRLHLGEVYLGLGDARRAEGAFRQVMTDAPQLLAARLDLAEALEAQHRLDEADVALQEVERSDAKFPGLAESRAALAVSRGQLAQAAKLYDVALGEPNVRTSLLTAAADVQLKLGVAERARELLERAVREDPLSVEGHLLLARLELQGGQLVEAAHSARRALALGGRIDAHLVAAQAEEALGHFAEARAEYTAAAKGGTEAQQVDGRVGSARVALRLGSVQDALKELDGVAKLDPTRAEPFVLMGDCYEELGRHEDARRAFDEAVRRDGKNAEAAFKLGRAFKDDGKRREASQLLDRAVALGGDRQPWSAEAWLLDGEVHRQGKERAPAVAAYHKYLELAPLSAPQRKDAQSALQELEGK